VFIDETGITTHMVRRFARALQGSRAIGRAPAGRYQSLTMVGAITLKGLQALMTIQRLPTRRCSSPLSSRS
jgi:hypothetical protein